MDHEVLSDILQVFGWIITAASSPFLLGLFVQGLVIFNYPSYVPQRWHATLLMWFFVAVPVFCNIYARKVLITLELFGGICHILFFICTVIILVVMAKHSTTDFVFETLVNDQSGWTNPYAAFSIGLLTPVTILTGFDGLIHMSSSIHLILSLMVKTN